MALPQSLEQISNAVHLSIEMQNLFAPGGIWATPLMERVLPAIIAVAELNPHRTVFTRFVTPLHAQDRQDGGSDILRDGTVRHALACPARSLKSFPRFPA